MMHEKILKEAPGQTDARRPPRASRIRQYLPFAALAIILAFVFVVRLNLLGIPFERDEGIYNYFGQQVLEGKTPYVDFYEMKPLGLYYSYAALNFVFGRSYQASHAAFMVLNALTVIALFFIGKRLFDSTSGWVVAAAYALLSLGPAVSGFASQSEHIVALFVSVGLLILLRAFESQKKATFFLAGLLIGYAFLVKQSAVFIILFGGLAIVAFHLLRRPVNAKLLIRNGLLYSSGVFGIYFLSILILAFHGALEEFWFWTYEFPKGYVAAISLREGLEFLRLYFEDVAENHVVLWTLGGVGLTGIFITRLEWDKKVLVGMFAVFSFFTIWPTLRFYGHYWIQLLPALSLLIGASSYVIHHIFIDRIKIKGAAWAGVLVFVVGVFTTVHGEKDYYFNPDFHKILRRVYGSNPFPEAKKIGDFIAKRTVEGDKVALIGSEPEIYIYSGTRAPSRHAYFSHLVKNNIEQEEWQREFVLDLEREMPKYLVVFNHPGSLLIWPGAKKEFLKRVRSFGKKYYRKVGFVDMISERKSVYKWHDDMQGYQAEGPYNIHIFERKL